MKLIVAVDEEGGIGREGRIPWYFPEDLMFFKFITLYNDVWMGRKTQDSLARPLPNRGNMVITRDRERVKSGFYYGDRYHLRETSHFVIGGSEIYKLCLTEYLDNVEDIYVTRVRGSYGCDTFFSIPYSFNKVAEIQLSENCLAERYRHV